MASKRRRGRHGAKHEYSKEQTIMKTVTIYTDGACSGNPGPGGWGAILRYRDTEKELSGGAAETTNNRMELTAVIEALRLLREPCIVELYSDSKYVIDALSKGWARGWKARGWVKSDKKPALNPDLWEQLLALTEVHQVRCHWVKGHAENEHNNRCDQMAVAESKKFR
jgi:ribonuclease H